MSQENLEESINITQLNSSQTESQNDSACVTDSEIECSLEELEEQTQTRNTILRERLMSLKTTMDTIKEQLKSEREQWKNELEEYLALQNKYSSEENECSSIHSFTDYQYQASLYEEAIFRAQAMKKIHIQRQLAMNNYRCQLLEVENMCNVELFKVKQNLQSLQPLQTLASKWNMETTMNCQGDGEHNTAHFTTKTKNSSELNKNGELASLDSIGTKFCNELNNIINQVADHLTPVQQNDDDFKAAVNLKCG